jgi:hypothetical protein
VSGAAGGHIARKRFGQLFLTDGHHSFTSLWEAPNSNGNVATGLAGGQVQMPVMIKGNYKDANNASFWRTMRASSNALRVGLKR